MSDSTPKFFVRVFLGSQRNVDLVMRDKLSEAKRDLNRLKRALSGPRSTYRVEQPDNPEGTYTLLNLAAVEAAIIVTKW